MGRDVFRVDPPAGPEAFKTYQIVAPLGSHFRKVTCQQLQCQGWKHGFRSVIDVTTELGARQADYLRSKVHGRTFTEAKAGEGLVAFTFPPGQACFRSEQHRVALDRPAVYVVRDGDHRGNPLGTAPVRRNAADWVEDFGEHQQMIADRREKG